MPKIYDVQDNGFSFKKASRSNLYHDTDKGFDFKRSNQSGLYAPSRNGFDFKRTGNLAGHELRRGNEIKKASGGAVTQPAMPSGPNQNNQMMASNSRNNGNLPF